MGMGVQWFKGRREGTPLRHALEADFADAAALKVEGACGSEPARTAAKAWHPAWMLALALLTIFLAAGSASAQAVKGQIVSVGIGGFNGQNGIFREGCWIPVQVRLRNMTGQPFVGHLAVDQDQVDLDGDKVLSVGPEFTLAPGVDERTLWAYYWPRPDYLNFTLGITKVVVLDKNGMIVPDGTLATPNGAAGANDLAPPDGFSEKRASRFVVVLGKNAGGWRNFDGMYGGTEAVRSVQIGGPGQLPDSALGLDGVDVILWEADSVKVSDIPPEFQLKAMLEWVKAGGHLIISVGAQGEEFVKAGAELSAALPLAITGTRDVKVDDVGGFGDWGARLRIAALPPDAVLTQTVGQLKPGARPVVAEAAGTQGVFAEQPLAVTGLYGQGAVTLITIDVAGPELQALSDREWIIFWNQVAGWRQNKPFLTSVEFGKLNAESQHMAVNTTPQLIQLGETIERDVDVKEVTAIRILVALAFLAVYWLVAGPLGHLVLRQYKIVHWSWWIFGGVVIVATGVAGTVVLVLHVNASDVRHRSFVLGTVNSPEATVASFYGIYSPNSGPVEIRLPEGTGLNYLAPLCMPTVNDVKSFADPQSYQLHTEQPGRVSPVFRNTLKKMQCRYTGSVPGLAGTAGYVAGAADLAHVIAGTLVNNSGYDLRDADVLVYLPRVAATQDTFATVYGSTYLYHIATPERVWRQGVSIDLSASLVLDQLGMAQGSRVGTVEMALQAIGWTHTTRTPYSHYYPGDKNLVSKSQQMVTLERMSWRDDLLYLLADARNMDELPAEDRRELSRGVGRLTDCTKALRAAGALVVAHAEDVKSPVALSVGGRVVAGKGAVVFAWALPLGGSPPQQALSVSTSSAPGSVPIGPRPLLPEVP